MITCKAMSIKKEMKKQKSLLLAIIFNLRSFHSRFMELDIAKVHNRSQYFSHFVKSKILN